MTAQSGILEVSSALGVEPITLTEVYSESINLAVWQRTLSNPLRMAVTELVASFGSLQLACSVKPDQCIDVFSRELGGSPAAQLLAQDIHRVVDMYSCLFDLPEVAIRLTKLQKAMCPKFHVDHVPARLVTTYKGPGTEWLPNSIVDRTKLGMASVGIADEESGLFNSVKDVQQLKKGDVALLKGESWIGNEGFGLVHRSPSINEDQTRLIMTCDFAAGRA